MKDSEMRPLIAAIVRWVKPKFQSQAREIEDLRKDVLLLKSAMKALKAALSEEQRMLAETQRLLGS